MDTNDKASTHPLSIVVNSFSYRYGLPKEADMVIDVRCLRNPFYVPELKEKTGLDPEVGAYISQDSQWSSLYSSVQILVRLMLTHGIAEGKSFLSLAFGCTGGWHRSVYVAETIGAWLKKEKQQVRIIHRDLN